MHMYICMYVYIHIYTYIYKFKCICKYTLRVCTYIVDDRAHIHTQYPPHNFLHHHLFWCLRLGTHTPIQKQTQTQIQAHPHAHVHAHAYNVCSSARHTATRTATLTALQIATHTAVHVYNTWPSARHTPRHNARTTATQTSTHTATHPIPGHRRREGSCHKGRNGETTPTRRWRMRTHPPINWCV